MFWSNIIKSLLVLVVVSIMIWFAIKRKKSQFIDKFTKIGYYSLLFSIYFPLAAAASWITGFAIRKSGDLNVDSRMFGIGGAEYGLDSDIFLKAALIKSLIAGATCLFCIAFQTGNGWSNDRSIEKKDDSLSVLFYKRGGKITAVLYVVALLNICSYFGVAGWYNLFAVDLNRWDLVSGRFDSAVLRISLAMTLPIGICTILLVKSTMSRNVIFVTNLLPAISSGSRIYSVLTCILILKSTLNLKSSLIGYLLRPVLGLAVIYLFAFPLIQRNEEFGGVASVVRIFEKVITEDLIDIVALMLVNVGQGFGVLVEVISSIDNQSKEYSAPIEYHILQFSPFPSFVDGYDQNWVDFNPRINVFTPINFVGHNFLVSPVLLLVQPIVVNLYFGLCSLLAKYGGKVLTMFIATAGIVPFTAIAEQYPPRNSLRLLEAGLIVLTVLIAIRTNLTGTRRGVPSWLGKSK
jgi:hypothetical protein